MNPEFYDLPRLLTLRAALRSLDADAPPRARLLSPAPRTAQRRLGVLCGSFNPLTLAHVELADKACAGDDGLDQVVYTIAKVTVDKEHVTGLGLEDRVLLLLLCAAGRGVALVNRGLYVEQARAFRALCGPHTELTFIIGMDKLPQVLDPRYYVDRRAALDELFSLASLSVANRGELGRQAFTELLDRPENRAYRPYVRFLPVSESAAALSSSSVREPGERPSDERAAVPRPVACFLTETRPYASRGSPEGRQAVVSETGEGIDAYAVRCALLERLSEVQGWAAAEVDFAALVRCAATPDAAGRALRAAGSGAALRALIQRSDLRRTR